MLQALISSNDETLQDFLAIYNIQIPDMGLTQRKITRKSYFWEKYFITDKKQTLIGPGEG